MLRVFSFLFLCGGIVFGQYKTEPGGAPPSELAPEISAVLQQPGIKVLSPNGSVYAELWFRKDLPQAASKSTEEAVTFPNIAHGTLIGAARFPERASDRRG